MAYSLDVELFINEVKKYPEIWDLTCEDYRHKSRKQRAWSDVARKFIEGFDDMDECDKDDVYRKLFSKWRNIRDSWVRHMKRPDGKKGYMYAKYLSFLNAIYKINSGSEAEAENDSNSNMWESDEERKTKNKRRRFHTLNDLNWSDEESPSTIDNLKRKRIPTVKAEQREVEFVDAPTPFSENFTVEDEDRSFFESLLPAVRGFDTDQKLEFRSQVINLVKKLRTNALHQITS